MVTLLYAALGSILIVVLWLALAGAAFRFDDWASSAWIRWRSGRWPHEPPPQKLSRPVYGALLAGLLVLFLGALVLPR